LAHHGRLILLEGLRQVPIWISANLDQPSELTTAGNRVG